MNTIKRYLLLKFSKPELDYFSTVLGLTATIFTVLTTNEVISKQLGTTVAGISAALVSVLINQPASHAPLTEATEDNLLEEEKERGS
jgi:hypothetical protein